MAGADIVALDATSRPRPDGRTLRQTVDVLKEEGAVLMADCSCLDDALQAADLGFDFISTTLAGYTGGRSMSDEPDWGLLESMVDRLPNVPVICEGRIHTPRQARRARDIGAWAVVVGTAITHPRRVTSWFNAALHE